MIIKPLIRKSEVSITNLPSIIDDASYSSESEKLQSIEIDGRLLMLTIMYKESNIKLNKRIHNTSCMCTNTWPVCQCIFARHIRCLDIGLDKYRFEEII